MPHFHANRYHVDTAEGSNQKGRPPIQYKEIPPAAQTSHMILAERTRVRLATLAAVR